MTKPNIVNFSDFHAHIFMDFSTPDKYYVTDRFKEQLNVLKGVFEYARNNEADVLFNGDLFHKRAVVDVRVFNPVYELFKEYSDLTVYMIQGNHDMVTNSLESENSLYPFNSLEHVKVLKPLEKVETPYYNLYGVGYGEETDEMKHWITEQVENLDKSKVNILCAHIGVEGSVTGKYSHTLGGAFKIADLYPDDFDIVTLGHYHKRQFLGNLPNVFYVGNTLQTSFSDEGQDKGFYYIAIDGKKWIYEFVKTTYRPFVSIDATSAPEDLSDAFYQFIGSPEEARAVTEVKEQDNLSNIRVNVKKDYDTKPRIDIKAGSTPEEVVKAYTQKNNPSLENKALDVIKKVMET